MIVGVRDSIKLIGISIIGFCAVLVCTMFLNFHIDIVQAKHLVEAYAMTFYEAQVLTAKLVVIISGCSMGVAAVVMLLFYIKNYIDIHKKEIGILKALGYSNAKIALHFWSFGFSVLIGAVLGFGIAYAIMPTFYQAQCEDPLMPNISVGFHGELIAYTVIIPTAVFSLISILYAYVKLRQPVMGLIKDSLQASAKPKRNEEKEGKDIPFLSGLRRSVLKSKKTLVFFVAFASFCFSAMVQMSIAMNEYSSPMLVAIMMSIGLLLAFLSMFLAITSAVNGNSKTIAMMRVFGYSQRECCNAVLGGYRPFAYIGFILGTAYQYGLLKIMVGVVFKDFGVPEYKFDYVVMLITLAVFVVLYEGMMLLYAQRINRIPVKQIMSDC